MNKGTFTMFNNRVGPGSTSGLGTIIGLAQAKKVCIFFQGSYALSAGTPSQVQLFPAVKPFSGSVDSQVFGTMVLTGGASASKRRHKYFEGLNTVPYLACKVVHATGSAGIEALVKAVVQHD